MTALVITRHRARFVQMHVDNARARQRDRLRLQLLESVKQAERPVRTLDSALLDRDYSGREPETAA